jgi:hypothetical protein
MTAHLAIKILKKLLAPVNALTHSAGKFIRGILALAVHLGPGIINLVIGRLQHCSGQPGNILTKLRNVFLEDADIIITAFFIPQR